MSFRWRLSALGALIVVGACTAEGVSDSTDLSAPATTTTAVATTTTTIVDYSGLLVETLDDPSFSADFTLRGMTSQAGGMVEMIGGGSIDGADSEMWMVSDFSGLSGVHFAKGAAQGAIGSGATTTISQAAKAINGTLYEQDSGGRWRQSDVTEANTTPGHIIAVLAQSESFGITGSEEIDNTEYVALSPDIPPEYDPSYFSVDPSIVETFDSETSVLVDDVGNPVRISVQVEAVFENALDSTWTLTYDLFDFGRGELVSPPAETWVSAASLGFTTKVGSDELNVVEFFIPASWESNTAEDGSLWAETPEGALTAFLTFPLELGADGEQFLREVAELAEIEVTEITASDLGTYSSWLGTGTADTHFGMIYSEILINRVGFAALWTGPTENTDLQMADFRDVLMTLGTPEGMGGGVVPGRSVGAPLLQTDTLTLLIPVAAAAAGTECESAEVLWTEVTGGIGSEWTEEWYVDACGDLQLHEVVFVEDSGGGTNILMRGDPRRLAEPGAAYLEGELAKDPLLAASLLAEQPWIIDPALGRDEMAVASAVTEARFRGSRLYVLVLADGLGEAFEGFADSVLDGLGVGTVLLIDPEYAGWSSIGDIHTVSELDQALDSALQGSSDEKLVERFVMSLHSDA